LEHGNHSGELEVIKTLNQWLELINNGDVVDLVNLVKSLDTMLNELGKVDSRLNRVGHTLDDNGVVVALGIVEKIPSTLEVATNADASSDSDFVSWESFWSSLDSSV
tara:strand:+ start:148 stop:468 length:321 start_codon:yes stop_codon:yes gene_type:complete